MNLRLSISRPLVQISPYGGRFERDFGAPEDHLRQKKAGDSESAAVLLARLQTISQMAHRGLED